MEHNIILDLDNTMIAMHKIYKKVFNIYDIDKLFQHENFIHYYEDDENYYLIYERPRLGEFLKRAYEYFDLYVFTMANYSYAQPIITNLENKYNITFNKIWTIEDTETKIEEMPKKDINITNLDKDKTYVFDDYPQIWKKDNDMKIIPITYFNGYFKVSIYQTDDFIEVMKIIPSHIDNRAYYDLVEHLDNLIDLLFIKN